MGVLKCLSPSCSLRGAEAGSQGLDPREALQSCPHPALDTSFSSSASPAAGSVEMRPSPPHHSSVDCCVRGAFAEGEVKLSNS